MVSRLQVVAVARDMLDTPFAHQGRMPGVALDCAGSLIATARMLGLVAPEFDINGYGSKPDGSSLRAYCDRFLMPIAAASLGLGDIVLVAWRGGPPQHLGIVADYAHGGFSMIHAESRRHRRVIETRLLFGQSMRLVAVYRFQGVA